MPREDRGELVQTPNGRWVTGSNGASNGAPSRRQPWTPEMREAMHMARKLSLSAMRRVGELLDSGDDKIAIKAAELLLSRVFGAPKPIELSEDEAKPVSLDDLPTHERIALLEDAAVSVAKALEIEKMRVG